MFEERAIALLESIDASLKILVGRAAARAPKEIAPDRDLDGKYGDPTLKFAPRDWTGASFTGRKFSECPPALLEMVAETYDYLAKKADEKHEMSNSGKPVSQYKRADAARARGWAKRQRDRGHVNGVSHPAPTATPPEWSGDEDRW